MKKLLTTLFLLFSLNVFAEPQKLDFQYTFTDSEVFEKQFPFLVDTDIFEGFKEYEPYAKENNLLNELVVAEFDLDNNTYYMIFGGGMNFCGSRGCYYEVFSKKENKTIFKNQFIGDVYLYNGLLYFQVEIGKL